MLLSLKRGIAIVFLVFFYCCAPTLLLPTEIDAQRGQQKWPDMDVAQLQEAHRLYKNKCGGCHFLYRPYKYSEEKWLQLLPDMKKEAKLDSLQYELIKKYVLIMREVTPPAKTYAQR